MQEFERQNGNPIPKENVMFRLLHTTMADKLKNHNPTKHEFNSIDRGREIATVRVGPDRHDR
jgi:hypothetical protein